MNDKHGPSYCLECGNYSWAGACSHPIKGEKMSNFDVLIQQAFNDGVKAVLTLIKKDCEHPKFGERCFHEHLLEEIEAQIEGENK